MFHMATSDRALAWISLGQGFPIQCCWLSSCAWCKLRVHLTRFISFHPMFQAFICIHYGKKIMLLYFHYWMRSALGLQQMVFSYIWIVGCLNKQIFRYLLNLPHYLKSGASHIPWNLLSNLWWCWCSQEGSTSARMKAVSVVSFHYC